MFGVQRRCFIFEMWKAKQNFRAVNAIKRYGLNCIMKKRRFNVNSSVTIVSVGTLSVIKLIDRNVNGTRSVTNFTYKKNVKLWIRRDKRSEFVKF